MDRYQFARADGNPNWSVGDPVFDEMYTHAHDFLRFHIGKGFVIRNKKTGKDGPVRKLHEIGPLLVKQLNAAPEDGVFSVRSETDNYTLVFRRHQVTEDKGQLVIDHGLQQIGQPYVLGGLDCSGLTQRCYGAEGVELPHNAHLQHLANNVVSIEKSQLKRGDLIFIHSDAHVAMFMDYDGPDHTMRVLDTEPSNTGAPSGWPRPDLGTGVRIRPAFGGYYCASQNGYGRVVAINGKP